MPAREFFYDAFHLRKIYPLDQLGFPLEHHTSSNTILDYVRYDAAPRIPFDVTGFLCFGNCWYVDSSLVIEVSHRDTVGITF